MGKRRLTKEEFEFLTPYKDRMTTAALANYTRAVPSDDLTKMKAIYERIFGDTSIHLNCGGCVLKMLKKLYEYYIAKEEEYGK